MFAILLRLPIFAAVYAAAIYQTYRTSSTAHSLSVKQPAAVQP